MPENITIVTVRTCGFGYTAFAVDA